MNLKRIPRAGVETMRREYNGRFIRGEKNTEGSTVLTDATNTEEPRADVPVSLGGQGSTRPANQAAVGEAGDNRRRKSPVHRRQRRKAV